VWPDTMGTISQSIGVCPLCGDVALLEFEAVSGLGRRPSDVRLSDVACKNERCKHFVSSDRVMRQRGRGLAANERPA
jgi:hypothetical protein